MIVFLNGQYISKEKAVISPDDRGFLFADGLYEVVRSYDGRLFKIDEHLDRLEYGARALRLSSIDFRYLKEVAGELIDRNDSGSTDAVVYLQVTRGAAPRTHFFPPEDTPLTVYGFSKSFAPPTAEMEKGAAAILVPDQRWARCDLKTVGLLLNAMAQQQAREQGALEAIFVRDGFVTEGTHTNAFAVVGGRIITYPATHHILSGITRQVVLELCEQLDLPVDLRPVPASEIGRVDELFITGTTVEVTPVVTLNGKPIGNAVPGPITRQLQEAFRKMTAR